jgi:hypothetical protein
MNNRLFKMLVTGGALLTSHLGHAQEIEESKQSEESKKPLIPVFCTDVSVCREVQSCSQEGNVITQLVAKEGMECCWGTSCADLEE